MIFTPLDDKCIYNDNIICNYLICSDKCSYKPKRVVQTPGLSDKQLSIEDIIYEEKEEKTTSNT